jgi:hypothetical protein
MILEPFLVTYTSAVSVDQSEGSKRTVPPVGRPLRRRVCCHQNSGGEVQFSPSLSIWLCVCDKRHPTP